MNKEQVNRLGIGMLLITFLALAVALLATVPQHRSIIAKQSVPAGDPLKAPAAIRKYGCGSCHEIPGVAGAHGMAGPKLTDISKRSFLAGQLPNNPEDLMLWIEHPQQIRPGVDMPDMGVTDADARNIAAYLYSLP